MRTAIEVLREDWRLNARCVDEDPADFFPDRGRLPKSCVEPCRECPVRQECLQAALDSPWEPFGVWGGLTQGELQPIWRERHPLHGEQEVMKALGIREVAR